MILQCDNKGFNQGCSGGDSFEAFEFIFNYFITDETCSPY